jgi:phosphate-selective porin O/P
VKASRLAAVALCLLLSLGTAGAAESPEPRETRAVALSEAATRVDAELAQARTQPVDTATAERLRALEEELARLREELRHLTEETKAATNTAEGLSRAEERRAEVSVYGNLDVSAYRGEKALFDGRIFEMVFTGRPDERLSFVAQVEFEDAAGVGGDRGGEITVEQAYATLSLWPALALRAGIFLVPFGNPQEHFPAGRDVVTRPLVSYVVTPSDWTDNGVGLVGRRLVGSSWLLGYEAWVMAGLGRGFDALGLRATRQGYGVDNNSDKAVVARLSMKRGSGLALGLSGYRGRYDDAGRGTLAGWGADLSARRGPVGLAGEVADFIADRAPGPDARYRGFYLRGTYAFAGRTLARTVLGRGFDAPGLALVGQAEEVTIDGPEAGELVHTRERRATVGLNYRPASHWVLKLGYEWNATTNRTLVKGDRDGFVGSVAFVF